MVLPSRSDRRRYASHLALLACLALVLTVESAGSQTTAAAQGVWHVYRWYIVGATGFAILQSALLAFLLVQRSRRRESELRNNAILRAMPDMMFLLSRDGVYLDFHTPDRQQLLSQPARFLGKHMRDVLPPELASVLEQRFAELRPGQDPAIIEYSLPMSGEERQYEARVLLVGSNQVLSIVRDITDRKRAEAALHDAQNELRRVSRLTALGEFAAALAHEVRQPLSAIMMNARSCLRRLSLPQSEITEIRGALLDVVEAVQRAEEVIRRNRELFRNHTVEAAPLDINSVIRDAIVLAATRLRDGNVTLSTALADDLPAISGDRIELQQVLLNLIANAIDAMERMDAGTRQLEVSSSLTADHSVDVAVADNGVGLNGVDLQRMFTLSYTTKAAGTGVGLSISRSIVEAHGGRLWAEQNPGRGATFRFSLPVRVTAGAAQLAEEAQGV